MFKKIILLLILLLAIPQVFADIKVSTIAEVDIYGTAKVQHTFQEPLESVDLNVYSPESLDTGDAKFSISNNVLHLSNVKKGTRVIYLSNTFAKKEGDWTIKYNSLNPESFKLVLPFSAKIKEATGNNVRSKDKTGQIIEWDSANDVGVTYELIPSDANKTYRYLVYALSVFFILLLIYVIKTKPWKKGPSLFIQRMKGTGRLIERQVIYAILVLAYERKDKLLDQSKIRGVLSKRIIKGKRIIEDINAHRGEISDAVNKKLGWLINKNESKISIEKEAEKEYGFEKNAKKIIKIMEEKKMLEKNENTPQ